MTFSWNDLTRKFSQLTRGCNTLDIGNLEVMGETWSEDELPLLELQLLEGEATNPGGACGLVCGEIGVNEVAERYGPVGDCIGPP